MDERHPPPDTARSRLGAAAGPALALVSPLLVLLLLEIALRFAQAPPRHLHFAKPESYRYDAELVYALRPGLPGHNALGLRNRELAPRKGDWTRILVLGDSYTYGHGVTRRQAYPQTLEGLLAGTAGTERYEVINAGVPGYNLDQAYALLRRLLAGTPALSPDWVIVAFEPKDLGASNVLFTLTDGALTQVPGWHNWIYLQLRLRSDVPEFLKWTRLYQFAVGRVAGSDPFRVIPDGELDSQIRWQIDKIERILEQTVELGRRHGFELVILNYPDRTALLGDGDYRDVRYFQLDIKVLGDGANEHMARVRAVFDRSGAHVIDALGAFRDRGFSREEIDSLYLGEDPHMSALGNRELAQLLRDFFAQRAAMSPQG